MRTVIGEDGEKMVAGTATRQDSRTATLARDQTGRGPPRPAISVRDGAPAGG